MLGRAALPGRRDTGRWRPAMWGAIAALLAAPLLAMQFTDDVAWTAFDFAVAGTLLIGAGAAYELVARRTGDSTYRFIGGAAIFVIVILIWAEGAVDIF